MAEQLQGSGERQLCEAVRASCLEIFWRGSFAWERRPEVVSIREIAEREKGEKTELEGEKRERLTGPGFFFWRDSEGEAGD